MEVAGKNVFLSGPMTGIDHYNVAAFAQAHAMMREGGAAKVYDPAFEWLNGSGETKGHEHYMLLCLHELTEMEIRDVEGQYQIVRRYDVLVRLPGWERSEGAALESEVARAIGMDVVDLSEVR